MASCKMKILYIFAYFLLASHVHSNDYNANLLREYSGGAKAKDEDVTKIVTNAKSSNTLQLIVGSAVALKNKRHTDAAFLFYAARFRAKHDKILYPPKGSGGDSPFVLYSAMFYKFGTAINSDIMSKPKEFNKVTKSFVGWSVALPEDYDPGYKYTSKGDPEKAKEALKNSATKFNEYMGVLSQLLLDDGYFKAFRTVQDYNMKSDDSKPTKEEYESATQTIKDIETEKKVDILKTKLK